MAILSNAGHSRRPPRQADGEGDRRAASSTAEAFRGIPGSSGIPGALSQRTSPRCVVSLLLCLGKPNHL
ncbi:hypothetical protein KIN20_005479 [Parelaphostrongylus tenuis]|uniref:Uncharacterized protein n=1 Tax=Parelaphostrongylus tenuis TaxID=148309 RepID=A0AAD5QK49_PARTN|nr:hypothetical protein KIN20_005479 [Parelaphostrongylus tenuis]